MSDVLSLLLRRFAFFRVKIYTLWARLQTTFVCKDKTKRKSKFRQMRYGAEKKYLSRYLYVVDSKDGSGAKSAEFPKIIWTCWWQGEESMPPVVKRCIESIKKYCPDYELRIVDAKNMSDYVELPDYIMQKHEKGYISRTHLSDVLRISLLAKYGGIWMDATVFLTAPLPQQIVNAPFFSYHCRELYQFQIWFIKTGAKNLLMHNLQKLLLEYWKYENKVINYFFAYMLFDLLVENSAKCGAQWQNVPLIYDDCYDLADNFFEPYSPQKWEKIKAKTTIHKLSWKYKKMPAESSFLQCLLDGRLEN